MNENPTENRSKHATAVPVIVNKSSAHYTNEMLYLTTPGSQASVLTVYASWLLTDALVVPKRCSTDTAACYCIISIGEQHNIISNVAFSSAQSSKRTLFTLLAMIINLAVQSSTQTFIPNAILFIDTSNNAWYNQVHCLIEMSYLSIIASDGKRY